MSLHIVPILDSGSKPRRLRSPDNLNGYIINNRFQLLKKIGAGTYGLIYLVHDQQTGHQYAAKMVLTTPPPPARLSTTNNKKMIEDAIHNYFYSHGTVNPPPESPQDHELLCKRPQTPPYEQEHSLYFPPKPAEPGMHVRSNELNLEAVRRDGHACPFLREIAIHLLVHDHPNIVSIHHVLLLEKFAIVTLMDYYPQGDLFGQIIDDQIFQCPPIHQNKELLMKNCMVQLIQAITFCAEKGVYHCDMKPENVMVTYDPSYRRPQRQDNGRNSPLTAQDIVDYSELRVSLIDFGLAMTNNLICCNACRGLSFYMAPERIVNFNTNRLVKSLVDMDEFPDNPQATSELNQKLFPTLAGDIWSLGVLFINISCSRNPWPIANINDRQEVFANYVLNDRLVLRTILPILQQFNHLLNLIFELNPNHRISLYELQDQLVKCHFFHDPVEYNEQFCTPPGELKSPVTTPCGSKKRIIQSKDHRKTQPYPIFY
ncbi:hypothetical protein PUMCH_005176 [Australozyma saopauloensis]|uniref:Protein kinase domain-containing protein n=1 Tax=Australozyma saopauloensis TaxID=291208 RepID=A0AAX4HGZ0_9ASCO|nr:hypothetical protein PUMCH_005176 [[Candida] saopauloensis]